MSQSTSEIRIVPSAESRGVLTGFFRDGARLTLARSVEPEVAAWIDAHAHLKDDSGRCQVVPDGSHAERTILTGSGPTEVKQPRIHLPAEQRLHIRTTNPIESTFSTVRRRHAKTKGSVSRPACLTMVYKLMESVSKSWRSLNGSPLLKEVIAGIVFENGVQKTDAA